MSSDSSDIEKIKLLVDNLNQEINSYTPWVSRKEIAAWSAIAIFVGVMFSVIKYILTTEIDKFPKYYEVLTIYVVFCFTVIIFSIIIFLFIHSQYSSIYDKGSRRDALNNIIFKLVKIETDDNYEKKTYQNVKNLIHKEYEKIRERKRKPDKNHIKRILTNLWIYKLFTRNEEKKLSTHETQEALLYTTIFFFDLVFLGSIILSLYFNFTW